MRNILLTTIFSCAFQSLFAQIDSIDYYYEIPDAPQEFSGTTVAARMIDGLGFRYYWATAGLSESDLSYQPVDGARTVEETIDHILTLTQILKSTVSEVKFSPVDRTRMSFEEKRKQTLGYIEEASKILKSSKDENLADFDMIFSSDRQYPFWNLLNGPIADAINHVGQIISHRRANGNPINQNISVLRGTVND